MIVDDEASLRKVLKAMLQRAGYNIETAQSGQAALAQLAKAEASAEAGFDLVICDIRMPEMSGMTLLEKLVNTYADLPVIMLTAHGTVDLAVQALKKGAFDFLSKPYEREEILMVIKRPSVKEDTLTAGSAAVTSKAVPIPSSENRRQWHKFTKRSKSSQYPFDCFNYWRVRDG